MDRWMDMRIQLPEQQAPWPSFGAACRNQVRAAAFSVHRPQAEWVGVGMEACREHGGGLRLQVQQVWDLTQARCRFGKYLHVEVNGQAPDIARLVREHPARVESTEQGELSRGLGVRLQVLREGAQAQLQLGDGARFYPSDAALASWMAQAHNGQARIIYD